MKSFAQRVKAMTSRLMLENTAKKGNASAVTNLAISAIFIVIAGIIIVSVLFSSASSFFPNWSSIVGAPTWLSIVMNSLISLFFVVLLIGIVLAGLKLSGSGKK